MREIRLNGSEMVDHASTHAYLKKALELPNHYGENLDALWDCLATDMSGKKIIVYNSEMITNNLGLYGESIIQLFWKLQRRMSVFKLKLPMNRNNHCTSSQK